MSKNKFFSIPFTSQTLVPATLAYLPFFICFSRALIF